MSNKMTGELGELVKSGDGKIHTGPFGSQLHASDYVEDGIPCIMPANMKNSRVDLTSISYISELDAKRLSKYLVKENDIIYSRRGDVTQKALIRQNEAGYFCGTGCLLLRPGSNFDARFLTYYLSTSEIQKWIVSQAVGATMPNLNTGILSRLPFNGPEKLEQSKIADVLSVIENKIELNNQINTELEAMAKTLYDYWFVQFDFPDADGKPYKSSGGKMVYNKVLKREIPEGWNNGIVQDIIDKVPSSNRVPTKEFKDTGEYPIIDQSQDFICGYTDDESTVIKPETAHVIFGDHTRVVKLVNFDYARGADGTQVLIAKSDKIPSYLLYQIVSDIDLSNYGYARHYKFLKDTKCVIPNRLVAQCFQEKVKPFHEKIRDNIFQNQQLEKLRDWLLPMLMNGQVTVK
ncbi:restriction endonuclease subunit S [Psychrobacter sp.]|uniref:restriction endonuclease subunit S n=2 Tax=Psychrobacter sp. TaxID=56811 RepID=UPI003F9562F3